ncbi:MAG TPA: AraC family transcriptional regulator [Rectinemataceae bacterium]|nr:AraC family transcriptional regulator [Rectinemataceae bacterium]
MDEASRAAARPPRLDQERAENLERRFVHPPYLLERRMSEHIALGELEPARVILKEINRRTRARLAGDVLRSLKNSLIASCTIFTRAAIEGGVDAEIAFTLSDASIKEIEASREQEELGRLELRMLEDFVNLVRRHVAERRNVLVWRAVKYIQTRIDREISLQEAARELGVSEQHLSSQFSKAMGESFVDYVQRVKVEEAQYYLRSTKLDIMRIAQMFGFSYQAYFSRVFRKVAGLTPSEYRRRYFQA